MKPEHDKRRTELQVVLGEIGLEHLANDDQRECEKVNAVNPTIDNQVTSHAEKNQEIHASIS